MAIPRITVLISGRGSNLAALVDAERRGMLVGAVSAVISNRADAPGLAIASRHGIATMTVDERAFDSRKAFDTALAAAVDASEPDLVVLAGFMRILGAAFVRRYEGRMLNIHPSLLPAYPDWIHIGARSTMARASMAAPSTSSLPKSIMVRSSRKRVSTCAAVTIRSHWQSAFSKASTGCCLRPCARFAKAASSSTGGRSALRGSFTRRHFPIVRRPGHDGAPNSGNVFPTQAVQPPMNLPSPTHSLTAHLRVRPRYVLALAASLAVHIAFSLWPAEFTSAPAEPPLQATITELPPPPPQSPLRSLRQSPKRSRDG
jgi:xanthosine utilization system XapX-like protein